MQNFLQYFGIRPPNNEIVPEAQIMEQPVIGGYLVELQEGLYETLVELGLPILKGQVIGRIFSLPHMVSQWQSSILKTNSFIHLKLL